jgi:predicted lipoprotein
MQHKAIKYSAVFLAIIIIVMLSLDIHRLDNERRQPASEAFDVERYVADLWNNQLLVVFSDAPELTYLSGLLREDPGTAFDSYSHKLGISNTYYFYVSGSGTVEDIDETTVHVNVDGSLPVRLETVYVFGNAIRDGSGLVDIDEFLNMMDFNMVSVYLNRKAKSEVIDPFRREVQPGDVVFFSGAMEIDRREGVPEELNVIPVQIEIADGD